MPFSPIIHDDICGRCEHSKDICKCGNVFTPWVQRCIHRVVPCTCCLNKLVIQFMDKELIDIVSYDAERCQHCGHTTVRLRKR